MKSTFRNKIITVCEKARELEKSAIFYLSLSEILAVIWPIEEAEFIIQNSNKISQNFKEKKLIKKASCGGKKTV